MLRSFCAVCPHSTLSHTVIFQIKAPQFKACFSYGLKMSATATTATTATTTTCCHFQLFWCFCEMLLLLFSGVLSSRTSLELLFFKHFRSSYLPLIYRFKIVLTSKRIEMIIFITNIPKFSLIERSARKL